MAALSSLVSHFKGLILCPGSDLFQYGFSQLIFFKIVFITWHSILSYIRHTKKWCTAIWILRTWSRWWLLTSDSFSFSCPSSYLCICSCDRWNLFLSGWNTFLSGSANLGWRCCSWSSVDGGNNLGWNMSGDLDGGEEGRGILEELELESEVIVTKDSKPLSSSIEVPEYEEGRM